MKYCIIIFTATLWSFLFPLFAEGQVVSDAEPQTLVDSLLQKLEQKIERQKVLVTYQNGKVVDMVGDNIILD